ncbi:hypothetical protein L1887_01623 [Cichorium endivia]|nr:hypothetical protein L1887_01623 [Cichorium endivia]
MRGSLGNSGDGEEIVSDPSENVRLVKFGAMDHKKEVHVGLYTNIVKVFGMVRDANLSPSLVVLLREEGFSKFHTWYISGEWVQVTFDSDEEEDMHETRESMDHRISSISGKSVDDGLLDESNGRYFTLFKHVDEQIDGEVGYISWKEDYTL